jgi:hypothetical protein
MKSKVAGVPRRKDDALTKRYARIGMRVVAAAAPYQPKPEDHPGSRTGGQKTEKSKSERGIPANK